MKPSTKCNRRNCRLAYGRHDPDTHECPDGSGKSFSKHAVRLAASQSFSVGEVDVLHSLLKGIRGGADLSIVSRSTDFRSCVRKIQGMKEQVERIRKRRDDKEQG